MTIEDNGQSLTGKGSKWRIHDINFDNIWNSFVSLFVLSTLEGWPDYMYEVYLNNLVNRWRLCLSRS